MPRPTRTPAAPAHARPRAALRRLTAAGVAALTVAAGLTLAPAAAIAATPAPAAAAVRATVAPAVVAPKIRATQTHLQSSIDAGVLVYLNRARAAYKLAPLAPSAGLVDLANVWATHLASAGATFGHNPSLMAMTMSRMPAVHLFGENIAAFSAGFSAYAIVKAYLASPAHRANILNPRYRYVGIVTRTAASGTSYNAIDFAG